MYPISFDNPNGRSHPNKAANRNTLSSIHSATSDDADTGQIQDQAQEDRLLVVECRTDDRWRVVLCTGLEDLDEALDTVRSLRRAEGTDEVSLTIEVSGQQGRESRREVVRFAKETCAEKTAPITSNIPSEEIQAMEAAVAAVSPAFKTPDISIDDMILPDTQDNENGLHAATGPSKPTASDETALLSLAWADETIQTHQASEAQEPGTNKTKTPHVSDDIPDFLKVHSSMPLNEPQAGPGDPLDHGVESVRSGHVPDAYGALDTEGDETTTAPELSFPNGNSPFGSDGLYSRRRMPQSFGRQSQNSWIDDLLTQNYPNQTRPPFSHKESEGDLDDDDDFATRLESPMFAKENGVTAKVLVFAGTVALLILGGALAELLAVDITSSANAQTRFLD